MTSRRIGRLSATKEAARARAQREATPAQRLHEPLHLRELLEEPIDVGGGCPAAERDAPAPTGLDRVGMSPFVRRHGVDDRLDALQLTAVNGGLGGARSEERRVGKECRSRWSP